MLAPTIREDLGRLRQIELAREAERLGRLAAVPQAPSARRTASALLALLRRPKPAAGARPHDDARGPGDEPLVSLRLLGNERHAR